MPSKTNRTPGSDGTVRIVMVIGHGCTVPRAGLVTAAGRAIPAPADGPAKAGGAAARAAQRYGRDHPQHTGQPGLHPPASLVAAARLAGAGRRRRAERADDNAAKASSRTLTAAAPPYSRYTMVTWR